MLADRWFGFSSFRWFASLIHAFPTLITDRRVLSSRWLSDVTFQTSQIDKGHAQHAMQLLHPLRPMERLFVQGAATQGMQSEAPGIAKPQVATSTADVCPTPVPSPFTESVKHTVNPFPAAAVAVPAQSASSPGLAHAYSAATAPAAAASSLSFANLQQDREVSPPVMLQPNNLSVHKGPQRSVEDLCFKAASLGISEGSGKVSAAEMEHEYHSSSSDNSSVHALEVGTSCSVAMAAAVSMTCRSEKFVANHCLTLLSVTHLQLLKACSKGLAIIVCIVTSSSKGCSLLQAATSGLQSAGSGHLVLCQEIWKR